MIGCLVALREEAELIIQELSFQRIHTVGQYNGFLEGRPLSLHLCRPGVKNRVQLLKWLKQHKFQHIINIGYAGALVTGYKLGQASLISKISKVDHKVMQLDNNKGEHLVSVNELILNSDDKEALFLKTQAKLVDMEAYSLIEIIIGIGFNISKFKVIKIIGDLPEDALYLRNEIKFRDFFSSRHLWKKCEIVASTGFSNSWFLYKRKKLLQKKILHSLLKYIDTI